MDEKVRARDYPYYRGDPVEISAVKWLVPLAMVGLAVYILLVQPGFFQHGYLRLGPAILLAVLPLLGLYLVAGRHWKALFRRVRLKDVGLMFGFAVLNYAITGLAGYLSLELVDAQPNAGVQSLGTMGGADQFLFFVNSLPQLVGEELITIVPFLAIIYYCHRKLDLGRNVSIVIAWLITAVWFALIHLPAYNFNILQCLLIIGLARLVLTFAYMWTKNLWVSVGAHIINDWTTFGLVLLAANFGSGAA